MTDYKALYEQQLKENQKLKSIFEDTKEFLEVCDRNTDGYYEHYETRQIAMRFEGGVYQKQNELEEENKKLKEGMKKIMEDVMESRRRFSQEIEMMQNNLDKAYACIERDCKTLELIEEIGVVVATKEQIDELTDNNLIRETLYELYDITLPEEDED